MRPLRANRKTLAILGLALALGALACALPEDPYQRWQLLDGTIHENARWIYERSHFDPTPIDVAIVGPSRTAAGVNAPHLAELLAARGLPANVVNFAMPETGRNLNYAIVEEMLKEKRPRLLVLGVIEKPSRYGHSAYKYVAPPALMADPGYAGNLHYFPDLMYLPFRQLRLFAADLIPGGTGLAKSFDPAAYRGHVVDTTGDVVLPDGSIKQATYPAPYAELMRGVNKLRATTTPPLLPADWADVEFGDERHYIRRIAALARARHVKMAFLFLPYYTGPAELQEQAFYEQFGPVWKADFLASHAELYADYGHLTKSAAVRLTDWLADPVASQLAPAGQAPEKRGP